MTLDADLFAGDALVARDVEVAPGKVVTLHFRELPFTAFARFRSEYASDDEAAREGAAAHLIAQGVANPDGSAAMTLKKALRLKSRPLGAIFKVLLEVNGEDDDAGNASPSAESDGSGTSSPSRSAAPSENSSGE